MSNYSRGRAWEYEVKQQLQKLGWVVFRCASSKPHDLVAFHPQHRPLWIECKIGALPSKASMEQNRAIARMYGAQFVVVQRKTKRRSKCRQSTIPAKSARPI